MIVGYLLTFRGVVRVVDLGVGRCEERVIVLIFWGDE